MTKLEQLGLQLVCWLLASSALMARVHGNPLKADDSSHKILSDPGSYGPTLEIVHLYFDEWPTGSSFHLYFMLPDSNIKALPCPPRDVNSQTTLRL